MTATKKEFCAYLRRLIGDLYEDGMTETAIDFKTALHFIEQGDTPIKRDYTNCTVKIYDVTYFLVDENGNEVLNEDGTTKLFKDYEDALDTSTWAEHVEAEDLSEKEDI